MDRIADSDVGRVRVFDGVAEKSGLRSAVSHYIAVPTPKVQTTLPGYSVLRGAGDDPGAVEVDDAVGEHLGVDAQVAHAAVEQQAADAVRHRDCESEDRAAYQHAHFWPCKRRDRKAWLLLCAGQFGVTPRWLASHCRRRSEVHSDSEREVFVAMRATKLYEAGAARVGGALIQGAGWAGHAVAQREPPAYRRGGSAMGIALRIRRCIRAGNLRNGWVRVVLCSAVALVVAVGLLEGAAQGWVGMLSVVVALFAACRLLDSDDVRRIEQVAPSTFNETTMPGSSYISSTGTPRPEPPPVGPVNTPRQDEIDALNRAWRASGNEPS